MGHFQIAQRVFRKAWRWKIPKDPKSQQIFFLTFLSLHVKVKDRNHSPFTSVIKNHPEKKQSPYKSPLAHTFVQPSDGFQRLLLEYGSQQSIAVNNYHVYISIISKLRYTSTASCWFTIWKLNKLVVKAEFNPAFTSLHLQQVIAQPEQAEPCPRASRAAQPAPGKGPAREGHPKPLSTSAASPAWSHLCQPSSSLGSHSTEPSMPRSVNVPGAAQPEIPNQTQPQSAQVRAAFGMPNTSSGAKCECLR